MCKYKPMHIFTVQETSTIRRKFIFSFLQSNVYFHFYNQMYIFIFTIKCIIFIFTIKCIFSFLQSNVYFHFYNQMCKTLDISMFTIGISLL